MDREVTNTNADTAFVSSSTRRVLERRAMPGSNRELVLVEVVYPPGAVAPPHRHPVPGLVYILEGVAASAYGDDAPRLYHSGDTLQDRDDVPHTLFRNADPDHPLRFLVAYVLEPERDYLTPL